MSTFEYSEIDRNGLADALYVARSGVRSPVSESDEKLIGFLLRDGVCDARIGVPHIEIWYSWLPRPKPSTYFGSLAPGLITQLMDLGDLDTIEDSVEFAVGPATTGTDRYRYSFPEKWLSIHCTDESILIRVRDKRQDLCSPLRSEGILGLTDRHDG